MKCCIVWKFRRGTVGRDKVHFWNWKIETWLLSSGKCALPFGSNEMRRRVGGLRNVLVTSQPCWYQFCQLVQSLICAQWLFLVGAICQIQSNLLSYSIHFSCVSIVWCRAGKNLICCHPLFLLSWQTSSVCHSSFPSQIQCHNLNIVLQVMITNSSELVDNLRPTCQPWVNGANSSLF